MPVKPKKGKVVKKDLASWQGSADHGRVMNNKDLNETEVRRIALEIEAKYINVPDDVWYNVLLNLLKRANT